MPTKISDFPKEFVHVGNPWYLKSSVRRKLMRLDCSEINLSIAGLPEDMEELLVLECKWCGLEKLPENSLKNLVYLDCRKNPIKKLPKIYKDLQVLIVEDTDIEKIPKTYRKLESLNTIGSEVMEISQDLKNLDALYTNKWVRISKKFYKLKTLLIKVGEGEEGEDILPLGSLDGYLCRNGTKEYVKSRNERIKRCAQEVLTGIKLPDDMVRKICGYL